MGRSEGRKGTIKRSLGSRLHRKPFLEHGPEFRERRVDAMGQAHMRGKLREDSRGAVFANDCHRLFHCLLGTRRLRGIHRQERLFSEPVAQRRLMVLPSERIIDPRRWAPYPILKLGVDDDDRRTITPSRGGQPMFQIELKLLAPPIFCARAITVEHHQCMAELVDCGSQIVNRLTSAASIPGFVPLDSPCDGSEPQRPRASKNRLDGCGFILAWNQDEQVAIGALAHPSTPPAKRVPRLTPPLQSRSRGC